MMTMGTRLLSLLGGLLLALFVLVGPVSARLPPPDRPSGPAHPGGTGTLLTTVTLVESGPGAVIKLEGPSSVQTGEEFTVTVRVTNAINLYGLQLALDIDLAKFKILAVTPGALFGTQTTYQVGPTVATNSGSLFYAVTLVGKTAIPFGGDAVLATLTLKTLGAPGQITQVWSGAAVKLGSPEADLLPASVTATQLLIGSPIQGKALSLDQPLADLRVALVELSTGYEIAVAFTDEHGDFLLATPVDGAYLIRVNDVPFLPAAIALNVTNGVSSVQQFQMDLTYGDWDGDGVITKIDLDRFAALYYGYVLSEFETWIDIDRHEASPNRFDLRDLYHVAHNNGVTTPPAVRVGWVYGTVTNAASGLAGAAIDVRTLEGVLVDTFSADSEGFYTLSLPAGSYRLTYDAAGHDPLTRTITVNPLSYLQVFASLPPAAVVLTSPIQVDLQWNAVGDMDSWLLVPGAVTFDAGQAKTVVSGVGDQGQSDAHPRATHSGDSVTSSGTESVVIHGLVPGIYEFWAQAAAGDLDVSMDAQVIISGGTHTEQTVRLSDSTGFSYRWQVFRLTVAMNGTYVIETLNTLLDPAELWSAGTSAMPLDSKR